MENNSTPEFEFLALVTFLGEHVGAEKIKEKLATTGITVELINKAIPDEFVDGIGDDVFVDSLIVRIDELFKQVLKNKGITNE